MKIRTRANFENGNVIYPKKTVPNLNKFYRNNFQNTFKISKQFFSYAIQCLKQWENSDL